MRRLHPIAAAVLVWLLLGPPQVFSHLYCGDDLGFTYLPNTDIQIEARISE